MKKISVGTSILLILFGCVILFFLYPKSKDIIQLQLRPIPIIKKEMTNDAKKEKDTTQHLQPVNK